MITKNYKQKVVIRRVVTKGNPAYKKTFFKRTSVRILILMAIVACVYFSPYVYNEIYAQIQRNDFFNIKEMEINITGKYLTKDLILDQSGLKIGDNIYRFSCDELEKKLRRLNPEIKNVAVTRWLPNKVKINIEERIPMGILLYNSSFYKVDAEGIVFRKIDNLTQEREKLPLLSGIRIMKEDIKNNVKNLLLLKLISLVEKIKKYDDKFLDNISEINAEYIDGIVFYTAEEGLKIKVGDDISKDSLAYLNTVLKDIDPQKAKYVDVRFKDKVIVGY